MSAPIGFQSQQATYVPPAAKPLDEASWRAWFAAGRAREQRNRARLLTLAKLAAIAVLLAAAAAWSQNAVYAVVVRFVVAAAAIAVMLPALRSRRYAVACVFGMLALLFNPVVPVFSFFSEWRPLILVASAAPFILSLTRRRQAETPEG